MSIVRCTSQGWYILQLTIIEFWQGKSAMAWSLPFLENDGRVRHAHEQEQPYETSKTSENSAMVRVGLRSMIRERELQPPKLDENGGNVQRKRGK